MENFPYNKNQPESTFKHSVCFILKYPIPNLYDGDSVNFYKKNAAFTFIEKCLKGPFGWIYSMYLAELYDSFVNSYTQIPLNILYCLGYYVKWNAVEANKNYMAQEITGIARKALDNPSTKFRLMGAMILSYFPTEENINFLIKGVEVESHEGVKQNMLYQIRIMNSKLKLEQATNN